jgi:rubrerythrin
VEQVGVEVEESAAASVSAPATQFDDSGFIEFFSAGALVTGEFRCPDCGYGAVVHRALPPCPMCGGTVWESLGPASPARLLD